MNKVMLLILDGWGYGSVPESDAILQADTPCFDGLKSKYPNNTLITYGRDVGLPKGQMGNSEVGHMNIGAGRIVFQELTRINMMVEDESFYQNEVLVDAADKAVASDKTFHLMGLLSDGGIHSHINHLKASIKLLADKGVSKICIHIFTDGRDTDPNNGITYVSQIETFIKDYPAAVIASIGGRYYGMDRDQRWERIKLAYDAIVHGTGSEAQDAVKAIEHTYNEGVTDEFIKPIVITDENGKAKGCLNEGDFVFCFNFRTDRCRQITQVLTQEDMPDHSMRKLDLNYYTMTEYDSSFQGVHVVLKKDDLKNTLGEMIAASGKTQLRAAETEKYPHVTFFFSGGKEEAFQGESRILVNSPKVATYDLQPEMSAYELKDKVLKHLKDQPDDFVVLNFANTDMVGHTGIFEAGKKAAETVDQCVAEIIPFALENNYIPIIIADHGNADFMINEDGSPHTAHTVNPVPVIVVNEHYSIKDDGKLGDLAPSILSMMGIDIPEEMSGEVIFEKGK